MTAQARQRLYVTWGVLLALDVGLQVMMKLAADQLDPIPFGAGWILAALSSWLVWLSLIGYFATFVLWLAILHSTSLSAAFPATALVYVLVPLCGWIFLKENFNGGQAIGIALILAGVILQSDRARSD